MMKKTTPPNAGPIKTVDALDEMRAARTQAIADYRATLDRERVGADERSRKIADQYVASLQPGHPMHGVPMVMQVMQAMPKSAAVKPMWLFFARCSNEIKIGFSNDPDAAVVQLARQRLAPVELLMFVAAARPDKARMLNALRGSKKTGGWFNSSAPVLAVVEFVRSNKRLPTSTEVASLV